MNEQAKHLLPPPLTYTRNLHDAHTVTVFRPIILPWANSSDTQDYGHIGLLTRRTFEPVGVI